MRCSTLLIFLIVCCTAGMMVNFLFLNLADPLYLGDDQEEMTNTKGGLKPWAAWWCHSSWILGLAQNSTYWFSKALTYYFPNYEGMKTEEGLPVWLEPTVIGLFLYIFLIFCCLWIFCRKRKQGDAQGYSRLPSGMEEKERESSAFLERRIKELEQQITQLRDDNKRITMVEQQIKELIDNKRRINQGEGDVKRRDKEDERISTLEQQVKELCDDKYIQTVRRSMTVYVILDKDTMNPYLRVSEDGRSVRWTEQRQNLTDTPERFDKEPYILGKRPEEIVWGYCWEVDVKNKKYWELGVAKDSVPRKGQLTLSPKSGFFVLGLWNGKTLEALTEHETPLNSVPIPKRVGVHVDYRGMKVTFYNAEDHSHIYTFEEKIDKTVRPFFSPGNNDQDPLILSSPVLSD